MLCQLSYWPKLDPGGFAPADPPTRSARYFDSLCGVCLRHARQNLLNSSRSELFRRFFVVL